MALKLAPTPQAVLHRIGRPPDPLAWPEPEYRGAGRFDDPRNEFGVLYAAAERRACYLETLDTYRPDRALLMRLDCWAIFEGAVLTKAADPSPIQPDDPDLIAVARAFELTISFADQT